MVFSPKRVKILALKLFDYGIIAIPVLISNNYFKAIIILALFRNEIKLTPGFYINFPNYYNSIILFNSSVHFILFEC